MPAGNHIIPNEMKNLDLKKALLHVDVPVKQRKLNNDIFSHNLSHIFNESTETADFPN